MKKTVCELFAGVGGFRVGLEKSSKAWKTVWANQWEPGKKSQHAYDCYCENFGKNENYVNQDIGTFTKSEIPNHNLLVGGFPCQDYSVARSLSGSKGIEGKKGVLWWQIKEIINEKKPLFILLENVDRLLKSPASQRGRDFGIILYTLYELDYFVEWRIVNAAEYGAAQRRRRVFIFAYSIETMFAKKMQKERPSDILSKKGFFAKTFPVTGVNGLRFIELNNTNILDVSDNFKFDFSNAGLMQNGKIFTGDALAKKEDPIPLKDILETKVDSKYYLAKNEEKWVEIKGSKKINRTSKNGHSYVFSEGPVAFPDDINKPARTMLTSETSVNRSIHVIIDPETNRKRLITPIEAERINGFSDNWTKTKTMPEKFRYFCMGNALVVPMITRMGKTLNQIFKYEGK